MSPRSYRLGLRQVAAEQTRSRVIAAARDLLSASSGIAGFTIDAVARQAGVARMTVYYQFGSKAGLLEALYDDLAARGGMAQLRTAFEQPEPLAALDPEFEQVSRTEWRRDGLRVILRRLADRRGRPSPESFEETLDVLHMLTSFEAYGSLATSARSPEDVASLIEHLVRLALDLAKG